MGPRPQFLHYSKKNDASSRVKLICIVKVDHFLISV
jgi:hypothetical protein